MRLLFAVLAGMTCVGQAAAGPWVQDQGSGFIATTAQMRWSEDGTVTQETSFYAEYGLRPRLTLGLDLSGNNMSGGSGVLFAVMPVGRRDRPLRMSVDVGLGARQINGETRPLTRVGFAVGNSWSAPTGPGWAAARLSAEYVKDTRVVYKFDAIYGRSLGPRVKAMLGVELSHYGVLSAAVVPALTYEMKTGRSLFIALEARRDGAVAASGVRAGLWHDF